jgi:hypothetical protein
MFCVQFEIIRPIDFFLNCVIFEDDNLNFRQPYKLNEVERALLQAQTLESLEASLVELFKDEYVSIIMMPTKNNIFGIGLSVAYVEIICW